MASNKSVIKVTDADVFAFWASSEDPAIKALDVTTAQGYIDAHKLLVASLGGEKEKGEKAPREMQQYTILVLNVEKGTFQVLGSGLGTQGQPNSDPTKRNQLQMLHSRGNTMALVASSKGERSVCLKVLSADLA